MIARALLFLVASLFAGVLIVVLAARWQELDQRQYPEPKQRRA